MLLNILSVASTIFWIGLLIAFVFVVVRAICLMVKERAWLFLSVVVFMIGALATSIILDYLTMAKG